MATDLFQVTESFISQKIQIILTFVGNNGTFFTLEINGLNLNKRVALIVTLFSRMTTLNTTQKSAFSKRVKFLVDILVLHFTDLFIYVII